MVSSIEKTLRYWKPAGYPILKTFSVVRVGDREFKSTPVRHNSFCIPEGCWNLAQGEARPIADERNPGRGVPKISSPVGATEPWHNEGIVKAGEPCEILDSLLAGT